MTITRIKTDVIYQHERYGKVLVTGIGKMYDEWSTTGPKSNIESGNVLVYFYDDYDGYGGMNPMPHSQSVNDFVKDIQKEVEEHDYVYTDES